MFFLFVFKYIFRHYTIFVVVFLFCYFFYSEHTFLYHLHICLTKLFYFCFKFISLVRDYKFVVAWHDLHDWNGIHFLKCLLNCFIYSKYIWVFIVVVRFNTQNIDYFTFCIYWMYLYFFNIFYFKIKLNNWTWIYNSL